LANKNLENHYVERKRAMKQMPPDRKNGGDAKAQSL
jgi:hypothetical protein